MIDNIRIIPHCVYTSVVESRLQSGNTDTALATAARTFGTSGKCGPRRSDKDQERILSKRKKDKHQGDLGPPRHFGLQDRTSTPTFSHTLLGISAANQSRPHTTYAFLPTLGLLRDRQARQRLTDVSALLVSHSYQSIAILLFGSAIERPEFPSPTSETVIGASLGNSLRLQLRNRLATLHRPTSGRLGGTTDGKPTCCKIEIQVSRNAKSPREATTALVYPCHSRISPLLRTRNLEQGPASRPCS